MAACVPSLYPASGGRTRISAETLGGNATQFTEVTTLLAIGEALILEWCWKSGGASILQLGVNGDNTVSNYVAGRNQYRLRNGTSSGIAADGAGSKIAEASASSYGEAIGRSAIRLSTGGFLDMQTISSMGVEQASSANRATEWHHTNKPGGALASITSFLVFCDTVDGILTGSWLRAWKEPA